MTWDGPIARWWIDPGDANVQSAVRHLARRLAGWAETWHCPIDVIRIGREAL
jgi:hypothetical protein